MPSLEETTTNNWEIIGIIAQSVTAILGLTFAYYIFHHERNNRKKDQKFSWYKEIVIAPHRVDIMIFFTTVEEISNDLKLNIDNSTRSNIVQRIKNLSAEFRRTFVSLVGSVDENLESDLKRIVDKLVDHIVEISFLSDTYNLTNSKVFQSQIVRKILLARSQFFLRIFRFEG